MDILLNCQAVSKSYGAGALFSDLSFTLFKGENVGLIGPNGSGKSTLLKILAHIEKPDQGTIHHSSNLHIVYVSQQTCFPDSMTIAHLFDRELKEVIPDGEERLKIAQASCNKIQLHNIDQVANELSGGWQKRIALLIALAQRPDLLLLDEPTNHLDVAGVLWLENLLKKSPFSTLLISHDRFFLENIAQRIIELNTAYPSGLFQCKGRYSVFLQHKDEFLAGQKQYQHSLASRVRREIAWLQRGPKARTIKSQARIEQAHELIDELQATSARNASKQAQMQFQDTGRKSKKLLEANCISKTIGGQVLWQNVELILSPGSCLGILGSNGSGKSTLLKILAQEIEPSSGTVTTAPNVRIVYFDQSRQKLDPAQTVWETLAMQGQFVIHGNDKIHVSFWAQRFLFSAKHLHMPVSSLSGGEQARLLLARLMLQPADILILDEPTNDLDIPTLEVLEESLQEFSGALLLVTHDRYLLQKLATSILALDRKGKHHFFADYDQWLQAVAQEGLKASPAKGTRQQEHAKPSSPEKDTKRLSYKEQQEWRQMGISISQAEQQLEKLKEQSVLPEIIADRLRLQAVCLQMQNLEQQIEQLYTRWQELEAKQS